MTHLVISEAGTLEVPIVEKLGERIDCGTRSPVIVGVGGVFGVQLVRSVKVSNAGHRDACAGGYVDGCSEVLSGAAR